MQEPAASGTEPRQPLHNWASHPADAFRYVAVAVKQPKEEEREERAVEIFNPKAWMER
jgi:hypothetical protein